MPLEQDIKELTEKESLKGKKAPELLLLALVSYLDHPVPEHQLPKQNLQRNYLLKELQSNQRWLWYYHKHTRHVEQHCILPEKTKSLTESAKVKGKKSLIVIAHKC